MSLKLRYGITKEISFSAGHFLEGLPAGHPCSNQHGHNYKVRVQLESDGVDEVGFIIDYTILKTLIKEKYDHVNLNDVMKVNPTAENLARDIAQTILDFLFRIQVDHVRLISVTLHETDSNVAYVRIDEDKD